MWRLGDYRLDPGRFALSLAGRDLPLQRRPFDVLLYLVIHRDRVVPRAELLDEVWKGVSVSDGALSTAVHEIRAALGDLERSRQDRWISTVRGRGLRFIGPVVSEEKTGTPADLVPYVGRSEFVARLVDGARNRAGSAVLVEGPAGMGKTRLLRELQQAWPEGLVEVAYCEPDGPPYWPWYQLVRQLEDSTGVSAEAGLGWLIEDVQADAGADSFVGRVESIARALEYAARDRAIVFAIEDLHWADQASLSVLESIAPRAASLGVTLVATQRTGDEVAAVAHGLSESPFVERLRLEPLSVRHLFTVVESILGRVPEPELIDRIDRASGGNPLIARELASRIAADEASWSEIPKLAHRVFSRRFESLSPDTRLGLAVAALCGVEFDAPLVEAALGDALDRDRKWIREATVAGVIRSLQDHPLRFRFAHALLRDAAEGTLVAGEAASWHARIVDALEHQHVDPRGRALTQLARHSAAAAPMLDDLERPLRYALLAARRAANSLDWAAAGLHSGHALDWIEFRPASPERDRWEIEAALVRGAAIAWGTGHVEETEALLERIVPVVERAGDDDDRAVVEAFRFANARILGQHDRARESVVRIASIHALVPVAECWRVVLDVLEGRLGEALPAHERIQDDRERQSLLDRFARDCGRDPEIDRLAFAAFACWSRDRDADALVVGERAIDWAERRGDARGRIWATVNLCLLHELRQDWEALETRAPEIDRIARATGVSSWLGLGTGLASWARNNASMKRDASLERLASILHERAASTGTSRSGVLFLLAARIHLWGGDDGAAERSLRAGISVALRGGERFPLAEQLRLLATVFEARGEETDLRSKALEVAESQGNLAFERAIRAEMQ